MKSGEMWGRHGPTLLSVPQVKARISRACVLPLTGRSPSCPRRGQRLSVPSSWVPGLGAVMVVLLHAYRVRQHPVSGPGDRVGDQARVPHGEPPSTGRRVASS